jgi:2-keto-3-deoxy-L-rhamnonate aldolase RhmA
MFVSSNEDLQRFASRGVSFFILGSDQALLRAGWSQQVRHFHGSAR